MNPYPLGPIQIISIIFSAALIISIIVLIRKKKLKEEYAILWLSIFTIFLIISIFRGSIDYISKFLGISYQPASLFILLIASAFLLLLHFSIIISDLKTKINILVTQLSLLEEKMRETGKGGTIPHSETKE
jgi:hypothetical protein